ncbi:Beta-glucosidase/6-phospho-beta-glucosidase/beta-galactosidase [Marinitoga hydrogenitolerans DSM 16785]|uniref:Beta-glucosidase/6-phospho-beta-glucosidase/beta-galactosidase n=1 Tax=Marinitoga hydrogenitolerans (strain DSM 16785 / JCM 12826 / AT1271) TaxID=1122195 RepID=A0A1M5ADP4_MARH1|nr:beta-galactosidase BgaS [Marinitoga hydrogenitolerans]SHF28275.1 Beta-glucosidase/6-phospho-beta-glucosidase/beta-galactosidase [Marinitoga hydrogenitolerans DSM 16785]
MIKFNTEFLFGISMSGFQFEMGGENIDSKTDWFKWVHDKRIINSGLVSGDYPENGANFWEKYFEDIEYMKRLGLNIVRIGIEWSRIFPESTKDIKIKYTQKNEDIIYVEITEKDLEKLKSRADLNSLVRYKNIIKSLKNANIKVIVDLNHFSLPLWLHDPINVNLNQNGPFGWVDKEIILEFSKYGAFLAYQLDEFVDYWSTINEPQIVASLGYLQPKSGFPPSLINEKYYKLAQKHQAEAHCRVYDVMKKFTNKPIGFIYSFTWIDPETQDDIEIVEKAKYFNNYHFTDMILKGEMDFNLDNNIIYRNDMKGKTDFLGINYYTRTVVKKFNNSWKVVEGYGYSCNNKISKAKKPVTDMGWEIYPEGIKKVILEIKERYNNPKMFITENGIASNGELQPYFIVSHLTKINESIKLGANVNGYMYWSIIDNYEWSQGFSKRFGLIHVDYKNKKRTFKPAFFVYADIIKNKGIPDYLENYIYYPFNLY